MAQVGSGKWGTLPNASRWKPHRPRRVIAANVNREGRRAPTRSISTRHEAPSSKHQAPVKFQIPSSKFQTRAERSPARWSLAFGNCLELGIWVFGFLARGFSGAFCLGFGAFWPTPPQPPWPGPVILL